MEEDQAHAYYIDLRNKGSGAAKFKEGLGFDKAGPGYTDVKLSLQVCAICYVGELAPFVQAWST